MTSSRPKNSNYTRGGQITFHNLTMFFQINSRLIRWMCYAVIIMTAALCVFNLDTATLKAPTITGSTTPSPR